MLMNELMDAGRDDAKNAEVLPLRDVDWLELRIGRQQPGGTVPPAAELFDGEVAVKHSDDDGAVPRREAFIDDENVSRLDSRAGHGIAAGADEECRGRPINQ